MMVRKSIDVAVGFQASFVKDENRASVLTVGDREADEVD
jgi:hypothetical protein